VFGVISVQFNIRNTLPKYLLHVPPGIPCIVCMLYVQCSLDLPFFKGVEKTIDECGETVNPENHFFNKKSRTLSFASWQNFASIKNMTF
jgi:hypothetical protein